MSYSEKLWRWVNSCPTKLNKIELFCLLDSLVPRRMSLRSLSLGKNSGYSPSPKHITYNNTLLPVYIPSIDTDSQTDGHQAIWLTPKTGADARGWRSLANWGSLCAQWPALSLDPAVTPFVLSEWDMWLYSHQEVPTNSVFCFVKLVSSGGCCLGLESPCSHIYRKASDIDIQILWCKMNNEGGMTQLLPSCILLSYWKIDDGSVVTDQI